MPETTPPPEGRSARLSSSAALQILAVAFPLCWPMSPPSPSSILVLPRSWFKHCQVPDTYNLPTRNFDRYCYLPVRTSSLVNPRLTAAKESSSLSDMSSHCHYEVPSLRLVNGEHVNVNGRPGIGGVDVDGLTLFNTIRSCVCFTPVVRSRWQVYRAAWYSVPTTDIQINRHAIQYRPHYRVFASSHKSKKGFPDCPVFRCHGPTCAILPSFRRMYLLQSQALIWLLKMPF